MKKLVFLIVFMLMVGAISAEAWGKKKKPEPVKEPEVMMESADVEIIEAVPEAVADAQAVEAAPEVVADVQAVEAAPEVVADVQAVEVAPQTGNDSGVTMTLEYVANENPFATEEKFFVDGQEVARKLWKMDVDGHLAGNNPPRVLIEEDGEVPNGMVKMYYPTGELLRETSYKNNKEDGIGRAYYKNGTLQQEAEMKKGELLSIKDFSDKGVPVREATFENGQSKCFKIYDAGGNVVKEDCF